MTERPILFKPDMVKAILDGGKTQTRRVVKHIPALGDPERWCPLLKERPIPMQRTMGDFRTYCPYGQPGSHLWVREPFILLRKIEWEDETKPKEWLHTRYGAPRVNGVAYKADTTMEGDDIRKCYGYKWKPSIHMPRWASRLTLEISKVRLERVQDITEEDAKTEGPPEHSIDTHSAMHRTYRTDFQALWSSIHTKDGYGWNVNPFVWVIDFEVIS